MRRSIRVWFKLRSVENGIIELKNGKFCKVLEIEPINFALKSQSEQENILELYKDFFNICDFDIQILIYSKKGNLDDHVAFVEEKIDDEKNEGVKELAREYINMVNKEIVKTTISKSFFIIFSVKDMKKEQAVTALKNMELKVKDTLAKCGNSVKIFDRNNDELIDIIYAFMNPITYEFQVFKEMKYEYKK